MMKKNLLLMAAAAGCIVHGLGAVESLENKKGVKAFVINLNRSYSVVEGYDKENIPYTNKINGKCLLNWIQHFDSGDRMKSDNVSVLKQLEDGSFTQERSLDSFSSTELYKCSREVRAFRTFEESDRSTYAIAAGNRERAAYEPEHLDFIEQLKSDKCVLCVFGNDKNIIVANAQGLPEQVCKALELKRSADIDQKFKTNISKSWKKSEQEKK